MSTLLDASWSAASTIKLTIEAAIDSVDVAFVTGVPSADVVPPRVRGRADVTPRRADGARDSATDRGVTDGIVRACLLSDMGGPESNADQTNNTV